MGLIVGLTNHLGKKRSRPMKALLQHLLIALVCTGIAPTGLASTSLDLVYKLSDTGSGLDALAGWTLGTGHNEGNLAAKTFIDNGLDYRSTQIDTWDMTDVLGIRVSFFADGSEQAFVEFGASGTNSGNFFSKTNVTASSWTDMAAGYTGAQFFSIAGDSGIDRHWFIESNYGGCGTDTGHMVVIDSTGSQPCNWETTRLTENSRLLLYADSTNHQNWTSGSVGIADVFAVSFVREAEEPGNVPTPTSLALLGLGILALVLRYHRRGLLKSSLSDARKKPKALVAHHKKAGKTPPRTG